MRPNWKGNAVARKRNHTGLRIERPKRAKLTPKEALKRMQDFSKRKDQFIAAVREGKNRGLSA